MLPAENRLKLPTTWDRGVPDFQFRSHLFKLSAKKTNVKNPKVGFIITAKVGKAALRNRIKRLLSKLIRPRIAGLLPGLEIVIFVYPSASSAKNEEISSMVNKALSGLSVKNTF